MRIQAYKINLIYLLENGHRLENPVECPQEFYDLMLKCWLVNSEQRPLFSEIVSSMKQLTGEKDCASLMSSIDHSSYNNIDYIYLNETELAKKQTSIRYSVEFVRPISKSIQNNADTPFVSFFKSLVNTRKKLTIFIGFLIAIVLTALLVIIFIVLATASNYISLK